MVPQTMPLRFIPLGGSGEIGKNLYVYEYGGDILVVDCGLTFPDEEMFGVDVVIPDITYLLGKADSVRGIVLTHGHEDHIGALPWVLRQMNVPVWGTRFALGLVRRKLTDHPHLANCELNEIDPDRDLTLGQFTVSFFRVTHSILDAVGLIIDCPAGRVIHSGDFKFEHTPLAGPSTDIHKIAFAARSGVLALMTEVTNSGDPGWVPSETNVARTLHDLMSTAEGKVVVSSFATNIARIREVFHLSVEHGRKICLIGRSMRENVEVAHDLGFLQYPEGEWFVDIDDVASVEDGKVTILATGSQGERTSALSVLSAGSYRKLKLGPGDLVIISADPIPGNERQFYRMVNRLCRLGAEVVLNDEAQVHVSGHANVEELKLLLSLTRPRFVVPVHGEFRHIARYKKLALGMGWPGEDIFTLGSGDVLELSAAGARLAGKVPAGRVLVDGLGVGDIGKAVLRDRRHLSEEGVVVVVVNVDGQSGELVGRPDVVARGVVSAEDAEPFAEAVRKVVCAAVEEAEISGPDELESARAAIQSAVKRVILDRTGRHPMIIPAITLL
ncbi:MAG: ribonuclease J [Bryobacteraceae bacterium]|jgi:ribonuclease J